MTKILFCCEIVALATVLGATAILTYDLFTVGNNTCIIAFEPIPWIRIPEIILGMFSIPFIIKIIGEKIKT